MNRNNSKAIADYLRNQTPVHTQMKKMLKNCRRTALCIIAMTMTPAANMAGTHQAICSYYTRYEPCTVSVGSDYIHANLPTDFLDISVANFVDAKIYKDIGKESNYAIGAATTVLFGPLGLLGFLATRHYGTIDYGIEFRNEHNRKKTAYIRFVNIKAADNFGKDLSGFLRNIRRQPEEKD